MSLLGDCVAGRGQFAEAEPLLLESYPRIREDRGPTQHRTTQALLRIVDHYDARGMAEEADLWRGQLTEETLTTPIVRTWLERRAP